MSSAGAFAQRNPFQLLTHAIRAMGPADSFPSLTQEFRMVSPEFKRKKRRAHPLRVKRNAMYLEIAAIVQCGHDWHVCSEEAD
jgi:hypothetical protein